MTILWIGIALFLVDAIVIMVRGLLLGREFNRYMEQHHPAKYYHLALENPVKNMLWLFNREDSYPGFIWFSKENLGDVKIDIYRSKLRWSFYSFLLNGIAAVVFFAVVGLWLTYG